MRAPLAALLLLLGLAACAEPEVVGRQMCLQRCEAEGRSFAAIEACRARCRDSYRPDAGSM